MRSVTTIADECSRDIAQYVRRRLLQDTDLSREQIAATLQRVRATTLASLLEIVE